MTYCFGKLPKKSDYRTLLFKNFSTALPSPPPSFDNLERVYAATKLSDPAKLFPMDGNDRYGDCTIAGVAHAATIYHALVGKKSIASSTSVMKSATMPLP